MDRADIKKKEKKMKQQDYEKCKLIKLEQGYNSIYGNPSFYIWFVDSAGRLHKAKTASNSNAGFIADNYRYCNKSHQAIYLIYHITKKRNYIIDEIKHLHPYEANKEAEDE